MLSVGPNPSRAKALVRLSVAQAVTVAAFDVVGRRVAALYRGAAEPGRTPDLGLNASARAAGVSVVRANGTKALPTQRVTVVR